MKKITLILVSLILFQFQQSFSQTFNLEWAQNIAGDMSGGDVAIDNSGNVFIAGYDNSQIIVSKYTSTGTLLNSLVLISNSNTSNDLTGTQIKIDGSNNVIVTGNFGGTVDFSPGLGTFELTGTYALFIAKYSNDLNALYYAIKVIDDFRPLAMSIDDDDNIYVSSRYVFSGNGSGKLDKFDSNGNLVWNLTIPVSSGSVQITGIDVNSIGEMYICGYLFNTSPAPDFDPDPNSTFTNIAGSNFFAKYTTDKTFVWAKGISVDNATSRIKYHDGKIILSGQGSGDIDPNSGVLNVQGDFFMGQYNASNGSVNWGRAIEIIGNNGSNAFGEVNDVQVSDDGVIFIIGECIPGDSLDFDVNAVSGAFETVGQSRTAFVGVYDFCNTFLDAIIFPTTETTYAVSAEIRSETLYVAGHYWGIADFDPNGTFDLTASTTASELFLAKYTFESTPCVLVGISSVNSNFLIFPNPTTSHFELTLSNYSNSTYHLFDNLGQLVISGKLTSETTTIDVKALPTGIYLLQVQSPQGITTQKLVKE